MVVLQKLPGTETQKNIQSQALSLGSRSGNVKARCPRLGAKVTLVELSGLADYIGAFTQITFITQNTHSPVAIVLLITTKGCLVL